MSDAELAAALGRPVPEVSREPFARSSSAPLELVSAPGLEPLVLKHLGAGAPRPAFAADPAREREAYDVLPRGLGAPRRHASGPGWLLLELVEGVPLAEADDLEAWEAAARWLAGLHATPVPRAARLLRHDAAYLTCWLRRASAFAGADADALDAVMPSARAAVVRVAEAHPVLVHGEAYPSNLLVEPAGRIRPVDWETIGVGAAALDLAALTSGAWDETERARVVAAYREAAGGAPSDRELEAARLAVALQWLGWSSSWTAPPEHRHDWLAEARRAAEALR